MPGVIRDTVDRAGGVIGESPQQVFCRAEGFFIAVKGEGVENHGYPPHASATMEQASQFAFINGKGICRRGDLATCGHPAIPGSSIVFVGDGTPHVWNDTFTWRDTDTWTDF